MVRLLALALLAATAAAAWTHRAAVLSYLPLPEVSGSAHERYMAIIKSRRLHTTELGRAWLDRADAVLDRAESTQPSFTARERFADDGGALAWAFTVRRGQRIRVEASFDGELFLDLIDPSGRDVVAGAAAGRSLLAYDVEEDGKLILRAQAELLRAGPVEITQRAEAALEFPVQDVTPRAVGGVFGDPRDGGRRSHEGIDIFAARGTPAVAAVDGWITGAATNRLGGNVVWLWSPSRRVALYYAHLDRRAVSRGQRVEAGDVIGYVGTTGNARGTAPHLHFGIYATGEGAIDPLPWVCDPPCGRRH
jgi:murein DD-endopeptidase MepM/ murein hydrolase activator NlpD